MFVLLYSQISIATTYQGEVGVKGIKWKNSGKYISCDDDNSLGKMYTNEGGGITYAFSEPVVVCHHFKNKNKSFWIIVASSDNSTIPGYEIGYYKI